VLMLVRRGWYVMCKGILWVLGSMSLKAYSLFNHFSGYRVVSCRVVSCRVMSCHVVSCRVMSCPVYPQRPNAIPSFTQ
jgi:hypothetical protein